MNMVKKHDNHAKVAPQYKQPINVLIVYFLESENVIADSLVLLGYSGYLPVQFIVWFQRYMLSLVAFLVVRFPRIMGQAKLPYSCTPSITIYDTTIYLVIRGSSFSRSKVNRYRQNLNVLASLCR